MWLGLVFFFSFFNLKPVVKRSLLWAANDSHELFLLIYAPTQLLNNINKRKGNPFPGRSGSDAAHGAQGRPPAQAPVGKPCRALGQNQAILETAAARRPWQPLAGARRCPHPRGRASAFGGGAVTGTSCAGLVLWLCQEAFLILRCLSSAPLIYAVSVLITQFSTP